MLDENWMTEAICRKELVDKTIEERLAIFFPGVGKEDDATAAKAYCMRCPVRRKCLIFATKTHLDHGVFGGQTGSFRARNRAYILAAA